MKEGQQWKWRKERRSEKEGRNERRSAKGEETGKED